jgi:Chaperone of endosialidase
MKTMKIVLFAAVLAGLVQSASAAPWVYRGSLSDGGKEANGAYDLRVTLVGKNGEMLAQPITLNAVKVQKGLFEANVDFGVDVARFPGAKIKTEVQQGGSGFVQLGDAKAVNAPDGGTGQCWAVGGNTTIPTFGDAILGTNDLASDSNLFLNVRGATKLRLRSSGGVETGFSGAIGFNSMALGSSVAEATDSFTVGSGRTAIGGTGSFVYSDSTTGDGSISGLPGEFLVRSSGGIAFNTVPRSDDFAIGPRAGGNLDTTFAMFAADNLAVNMVTDDATNSLSLNTFRAGSQVITNGAGGLRVNNGIELGPTTNTVGPTIKNDGDNIILRGAPIFLSNAVGRIGLNRFATANSVEVGGNASKDTAGAWLANSDARIKTNIAPIPNALDRLSALRPVTFQYSAEYLAAHPGIKDVTYYNVIAQEFQKVFPDAVQGSGEYLAGKAHSKANEILQVDTYPAQIVAIAAIQELNAKLEIERAENAALKARLEALEARLK